MSTFAISANPAGTGNDSAAEPEILAAVDLGSNSFHMVVARFDHGQLTVVDRLREMVRLADGLDENNHLNADSCERALACLSRFGERLRSIHAHRVRVVGTNTCRKVSESSDFLDEAESLLGHPVEVISGIEEARLIYHGASNSLPPADGAQLIVDIGGGSTEIIRGHGFVPEYLQSLSMGCVVISNQFFANQKLTPRRFEKARLAAKLELAPIKSRIGKLKSVRCVGTSGTIRAARNVLRAMEGENTQLSLAGVEGLIQKMIAAEKISRLNLPGLSELRKPVFPGGVAILAEVMSSLGMKRMIVADGSLREGILHDLVGRLSDEDARVRTVRAMEARFNVDVAQADRVETTALSFLEQVVKPWGLAAADSRDLLGWAARLHEMGLDIAHSQYHRHGAYLLEHADMPGFPRSEQRILARLVGAHRRGFSRKSFCDIAKKRQLEIMRLAVLLRLAVLFNRSRKADDFRRLRLKANDQQLTIRLPADWLADNPLTFADLRAERNRLKGTDVRLNLKIFDA